MTLALLYKKLFEGSKANTNLELRKKADIVTPPPIPKTR